MADVEEQLRERLSVVGHNLYEEELTHGTAGNISARIPQTDKCLIKPSGFRFCDLEPENFLLVDIHTREVIKGISKPSIETPFHTKLYLQWPDAGGVVHIHPEYSTILATIRKQIVIMGLDIYSAPALAKGIAFSKFAPPGSEELADNLVAAMKEHVACLMPHHGCTTIGKTIEEAAINAKIVEALAKLNYKALLVGKTDPLPQTILDSLMKIAKEKNLLI
jgi:L-fuculose-phosphate aldolase